MTFKRLLSLSIALCLVATLAVAMSGCDDLGAYEDTDEYYNAFGEIVLLSATSKAIDEYSVETYFYNKESREDFLKGEDGAYEGIAHSDYVYMAIPLESSIEMDTLALFMQSKTDATVYINVFVTDTIPTAWKSMGDNVIQPEPSGESPDEGSGEETEEKVYDDPAPETRVGEITVHLKAENWSSFLLDTFRVDGEARKSMNIQKGQYILLQFRNNSGVRLWDGEKQTFVDPQTGLELQSVELTMTNLLIRALEIMNEGEVQGGK